MELGRGRRFGGQVERLRYIADPGGRLCGRMGLMVERFETVVDQYSGNPGRSSFWRGLFEGRERITTMYEPRRKSVRKRDVISRLKCGAARGFTNIVDEVRSRVLMLGRTRLLDKRSRIDGFIISSMY